MTARSRSDRATAKAEQQRQQIVEKSIKHASHVEEVLFVNEVTQQNKAIKLETKQNEADINIEARREEHRLHSKERTEAHQAVLERSKEINQQKVEKAQQRSHQCTAHRADATDDHHHKTHDQHRAAHAGVDAGNG